MATFVLIQAPPTLLGTGIVWSPSYVSAVTATGVLPPGSVSLILAEPAA